ncbi:MAG: RdgB/HAM1 family non-canonical purine NTP pyrophosphatase [Oligoflexales bacterium]|nr:RdgB/HAM1 family non-canonical purine NTP pyrophosphatase [Oligoflexales bacterium]
MNKRILYLASNNRHKLTELKSIISSGHWDIRLCSELSERISWEETGATFEENARIKALAVKKYTNHAVLADDSGLCVHYLGQAPGVHSSRYSGEGATDEINRKKLLEALKDIPLENRSAEFICCLVFIDENGKESVFKGTCKGKIIDREKGSNGFGYDPLFLIEGSRKTMAELSSDEKNSLSHRRRALDSWMEVFC